MLEHAEGGEPQAITRHGREVAVVLSADAYRRLAGRPNTSLAEFLADSGFAELELPPRDARDSGRDVDL